MYLNRSHLGWVKQEHFGLKLTKKALLAQKEDYIAFYIWADLNVSSRYLLTYSTFRMQRMISFEAESSSFELRFHSPWRVVLLFSQSWKKKRRIHVLRKKGSSEISSRVAESISYGYNRSTEHTTRRSKKNFNFWRSEIHNRTTEIGKPCNIRGSLNKFPDVFRMGTFLNSTHMKL